MILRGSSAPGKWEFQCTMETGLSRVLAGPSISILAFPEKPGPTAPACLPWHRTKGAQWQPLGSIQVPEGWKADDFFLLFLLDLPSRLFHGKDWEGEGIILCLCILCLPSPHILQSVGYTWPIESTPGDVPDACIWLGKQGCSAILRVGEILAFMVSRQGN